MSSGKHLNGIHVNHCKNTAGQAIIPMTLPEKVYIPMSQHIGAPCQPVVAVGDHVKVGQKIGDSEAFVCAPIHSSVSGDVTAINKAMSQMGRIDTIIEIVPDGKQEIAETVVPPVITDKASFIKAVRESGVVGLGGATFPMSVKFNVKPPAKVDTFIVNGAECEPYITVDHQNMLTHAQEIIDGVKAVLSWLEIERAFIGIETNKPDAIKLFKDLLKDEKNISVAELRQVYPQGAERVIIYETTGRHLIAGKLPADVGCIVSNVTSVLKMQQFLATGMPLVSKAMTVDGNAVANPQNVEVPIGTPLCDVIEFCGGTKAEVKKIVLGGPMMGRAIPKDEYGVMKGNSAILCFDETAGTQLPDTACISCGRCVRGCPMNLMPTKLAKAWEHQDIDTLREYDVTTCMECGCCSYSCPARKQLSFEIKLAKTWVMGEDRKAAEKAKAEAEAAKAKEEAEKKEGGEK